MGKPLLKKIRWEKFGDADRLFLRCKEAMVVLPFQLFVVEAEVLVLNAVVLAESLLDP